MEIPKSSFDNYKSGKLLIPDKLFEKLFSFLTESQKEKIVKEKENIADNFGQILGGKNAYKVNLKKFEEERKKGLKKLRNSKKLNYQKDRFSFKEISFNEDICEMVGAFIGDGFFNFYKNKLYHIEFSGDSRYDLNYYQERIIPIIQSIIPKINCHVYLVKNSNTARIVLYSKSFYYSLKDRVGFTPGKKTHSVSIPQEIIESEFVNSTIPGFLIQMEEFF